MIFLDSDILSYYFSGNIKIQDKIIEIVKNKEQIALTAINVYEMLKGFRWRNNVKKEKIFKEFLETIPVFTIDDNAVLLAADIYADLRKNGKTIGDADILIAAIVISNNGKLISNNTKHYENIKELNLINWLA
ncbi:MAG: PIN domain-containing protein [Treponema sp.]|jgi:tRNA(fMet)-specific endonuclease VapC|nr:PIN domain-containing protein [Treponema sp.]